MKQFMPANAVVILLALLVIAAIQWSVQLLLKAQNINLSPLLSINTIVAAAIIIAVVWWVNKSTVAKYIRK